MSEPTGPALVQPLGLQRRDPWRETPVVTVTATFAFVDLAGFTALTEAHGDDEAVGLLDEFVRISAESVGPKGQLVKTIGDAVMLKFFSPGAAVAAVAKLFAALDGSDLPIARAGVHHGEAIERDRDYFGSTINLTARVAGQAAGGQVLATAEVAVAARCAGVPVIELGAFELRNISEPVELFQLEVRPNDPETTIDPVCRMQVSRSQAAGHLRHRERDHWFCSLSCAAVFAAEPDRYSVATG